MLSSVQLINQHQRFLLQLPKLPQPIDHFSTLHTPRKFYQTLLSLIVQAQQRIYITVLYLEQDSAGETVLDALYQAKQANPQLDIALFVDWHRAQRGRIGDKNAVTNASWYHQMAKRFADVNIPIYGVPVNTREALGVLHLKGMVIDDTLLYSGASINDVYCQQENRYRYDRYQLLANPALCQTFVDYLQHLRQQPLIEPFGPQTPPSRQEIRSAIKQFREKLRRTDYLLANDKADNQQLSVTPLVGLGKQSLLNQTIYHLIASTEHKLTLCTPYFNLPMPLMRAINQLLRNGKSIELIVGDKTANDFYIPAGQPFNIVGALPYLYEINLRRLLSRLRHYLENGQLVVRLWRDGDNSYHLKGVWVDDRWMLLTGHNLNPRAWRLDLENGLLIHDPQQQLLKINQQELVCIRRHTVQIEHYRQLEKINQYPLHIRKIILRLRRIQADKVIKRLL